MEMSPPNASLLRPTWQVLSPNRRSFLSPLERRHAGEMVSLTYPISLRLRGKLRLSSTNLRW